MSIDGVVLLCFVVVFFIFNKRKRDPEQKLSKRDLIKLIVW